MAICKYLKFPSFQSIQQAIPKQEEQTNSSDGLVTGQLADLLIDGDGMNNDIGETSKLSSGEDIFILNTSSHTQMHLLIKITHLITGKLKLLCCDHL